MCCQHFLALHQTAKSFLYDLFIKIRFHFPVSSICRSFFHALNLFKGNSVEISIKNNNGLKYIVILIFIGQIIMKTFCRIPQA